MTRYQVVIERPVIQRQILEIDAETEDQARHVALNGYDDGDRLIRESNWGADDILDETTVTSLKVLG